MHIARVGERLPRLQIQFRISRSFRPRNLANLGSKIGFWIRRKEHTLSFVKIYKILKDKESPSSPQFKEMQTSFLLKKENKTETKQIMPNRT